MSDDVQSAGSSSATPSGSDVLASLTPDQRTTWQTTGALPTDTATPDAHADSSSAADPTRSADSSPATQDQTVRKARQHPDAQSRIQELLAKNAALEVELGKRQPKAAQPSQAPADSAPAAPSFDLDSIALPAHFPKEPTASDYADYNGYVKAQAKWENRAEDYRRTVVADAQRRHTAAQAAEREVATHFDARVKEARQRYADFDAVALDVDSVVPQGSVIDAWILDEPTGPDVLYYLQKNPAEVTRILALKPTAQARALAELEGKIAPPKPKTVTGAPKPLDTLDTRPSAGDDVSAALTARDFASYAKQANQREMAARGGAR